jgi:hypothetical protein
MIQNLTERVGTLVHSLSAPEKKILDYFLSTAKNKSENILKLPELLNSFETGEILTVKIPKDKRRRDAHRKNLEGLEDRMLDILLMDVNLDRNGRYEISEKYSLVLLKDQMKATLLRQRGSQQKAFEKLQRTA